MAKKLKSESDLDLSHYEEVVEKVGRREGSSEYQLNLACWLGERTHYLIAEIKRLRKRVKDLEKKKHKDPSRVMWDKGLGPHS